MITAILTYKGTKENLNSFVQEMISTSTIEQIRKEEGNIRYEYFYPINDNNRLILIDSWKDQNSLDIHHKSKMMETISKLREKYDLHMEVEKYISLDDTSDEKYIRK